MLALQALIPDALATACGLTAAEARKVVSAVHRGQALERVAGVRRVALDAVTAGGHVPSLTVRSVHPSALDPFVKVALLTPDGFTVESVRIPLERSGRFSACVSSQVGCALGCAFCATGRLGLGRNLETWEIVEQVRILRGTLAKGQRIHGVVFQGMGEPLANADRVFAAIRVLCDPSALAIDSRAMTVCTAGLPSGIRRLARELPKVRLGLSIASAVRETRRKLMPIENAHPLDEVIDAVEQHALTTGLSPMWAITPLAGVNDGSDDAAALGELVRRFRQRTGIQPRVSVVPYNTIESGHGDPFRRGQVADFVVRLAENGVRAHLRYSGGSDIGAACGQLAGRV